MELKLSPRIAIDFFFLLAFFDPYGDFLLFLLKLNREFTAKVRALCLYVGKGKKKTTNAVNLSKKNRWKAIRDLPPRPCSAALFRLASHSVGLSMLMLTVPMVKHSNQFTDNARNLHSLAP